ncbi:RNase P/MRP, p29 subunit [Hortaea werneckii]|uniref:Ribonuclease P protein subunit n=1 Tax=Hortaea werneckii TaxID=91943 RepID=A0A3M7FU12_HORWE|nr:RNase P/MRP, p29 subunit [Hortaea werneckii]KAI7565949.1 RNase P/MRP, p29 subunit [Hortaea werneckii]KAI7611316.1 RNase P/MRP, p29 subunit [Hortaea werneckii]KAI7627769.1 RNase P/MRP, p29 subunit [Hortaea werneckii]KAI7669923.1 RNase P/MRP, p29 subunit [Hortaea werneckii]
MATEPKEHIAEALLKRAHSPDQANTIFRERVKQRPLLLRPTSPDPDLDARSKRQSLRDQKTKPHPSSTKPKPLSAKQKRRLSLYDIPAPQRKYAIYAPLHRMWCAYIREILGLGREGKRTFVDANSAGPILVSADYHGALLEVTRSRCLSRVGVKGIVVKDTKFTFEVVTARDEVKVLPKEHSVFRFEVPLEDDGEGEGKTREGDGTVKKEEKKRKPVVFEIQGGQFENRAPDRANKKFRAHYDPEL